MQHAEPQYDIGVIVGRFQVHELHQGHRDLIQHVIDRHEKAVILLGLSPLATSTNNPLDFEARKQLLLSEFPEVNVLYIKDQSNDEAWSKRLDEIVNDVGTPGQSAVLYGGRDSFIDHYRGQFPTQELVQAEHYSGTAVRKQIARSSTRSSADFRAGVIWASTARYPTCFPTVDVAVIDEHDHLLLGRKPNERLYRFIGGFADPRSESYEEDAKREVAEEAGIAVDDLRFIGSMVVDDWRYRNEPDCIKTMLFRAQYTHGRPTPGDDIEEVRWFDFGFHNLNRDLDKQIVPEHLALMQRLRAWTIHYGKES